MSVTEGRKNMSSRVHKLVKFIPFLMHLNDFPHIMLFKFIPFLMQLNDFPHVMYF